MRGFNFLSSRFPFCSVPPHYLKRRLCEESIYACPSLAQLQINATTKQTVWLFLLFHPAWHNIRYSNLPNQQQKYELVLRAHARARHEGSDANGPRRRMHSSRLHCSRSTLQHQPPARSRRSGHIVGRKKRHCPSIAHDMSESD